MKTGSVGAKWRFDAAISIRLRFIRDHVHETVHRAPKCLAEPQYCSAGGLPSLLSQEIGERPTAVAACADLARAESASGLVAMA